MKYGQVIKGQFLSRPNRFVAQVLAEGREQTVHVKNTGRCRELLVPGATVYLEKSSNPARKTAYSLIGVEKGELLINMDSQAPNKVAAEALAAVLLPLRLQGELTHIRPEYSIGDSRLDFLLETPQEKAVMEVKGVTLEQDGVVLFPDAPTQRDIKHLRELSRLSEEGWRCFLLLVIQMERADYFTPNDAAHPQFGQALRQAKEAGVELLAYTCRVTPDSLALAKPVPIRL